MISHVNSVQTNPSFGWINIEGEKTINTLTKRLKQKEVNKLKDIVNWNNVIPYETKIYTYKKSDRLACDIIKDGKTIASKMESVFAKLFNSSPIEFIDAMGKKTDKLYTKDVHESQRSKAIKSAISLAENAKIYN